MDTIAPHPRTHAAINGALGGIGAVALVDGVFLHLLLGWHHAIPGRYGPAADTALALSGAVMLAAGLLRERTARRAAASPEEAAPIEAR